MPSCPCGWKMEPLRRCRRNSWTSICTIGSCRLFEQEVTEPRPRELHRSSRFQANAVPTVSDVPVVPIDSRSSSGSVKSLQRKPTKLLRLAYERARKLEG